MVLEIGLGFRKWIWLILIKWIKWTLGIGYRVV